MSIRTTSLSALLVSILMSCAFAGTTDPYDVSWDTPGPDALASMPLGNGDIALNVWAEPGGDILFYIAKNDAWADNVARQTGLPKVGRVRVSLSPNPFASAAAFQQKLHLADASVVITSGGATVRFWVDANHPAIHVDASSDQPVKLKVTLEPYRTEPTKDLNADTILTGQPNRVVWCYRNRNTQEPELTNRTFGGIIEGEGLKSVNDTTLMSEVPAAAVHASIHVLTTQSPTVDAWKAAIESRMAETNAVPLQKAFDEHTAWWSAFWDRSYIHVTGTDLAQKVSQGYILQRFKNACTSRGEFPIKFNGSLFVVDNVVSNRPKGTTQDVMTPVTAEYRAWGGQYWFQNTRPIYWPMMQSGDFDLMQPLFRMYRNIISRNAPLVKQYYNHDGSYIAETAPFYGGITNLANDPPSDGGSYTRHYFTPVLELSSMMLDYYSYTHDDAFLKDTLLPVAEAGVTFFDQHFKRDANGKLLLEPDNSIEMFWKVKNPLPDIAGLHWVLQGLLALPENLTAPAARARWQKLLSDLPPIPVGERQGKRMLFPYEPGQDPKAHNSENPELYAVYPFRIYGLGKPDINLAQEAFDARRFKGPGCWSQDPVEAALLGRGDLAQGYVTFNLLRKDKKLKFPAFWAAGHDYQPDEDNGGNGMLALQTMLLQYDGDKILLLPAWPNSWDADFKLHAPKQTTVEAKVRAGKLVGLKVTPESRKADVIISPGG